MDPITRRQANKVALAAFSVAVLGEEEEAAAAAWFWAAARFVGSAVASWLISEALNTARDNLTRRFAIEKDRQKQWRVSDSSDTVVILGNNVQAGRAGDTAHTIDNCLFSAFTRHNVELARAFKYWGRPTSVWTVRALSDGLLIAQWWTPYKGDRRYVVTRTYNAGKSHHFIAFRDRSDAARVAKQVVEGANPTRDRMKDLFYDPRNFAHDPNNDPPGT